MATAIIENRFKDLDISLRRNPNTGDIYSIRDIEAVKRSVKLLVLTQFSEIPVHSEIGTYVYSSLFENFGIDTQIKIKRTIKDAINNFAPRVNLIDVTVLENIEDHSIEINVVFSIKNVPDPISVNINLERVR